MLHSLFSQVAHITQKLAKMNWGNIGILNIGKIQYRASLVLYKSN